MVPLVWGTLLSGVCIGSGRFPFAKHQYDVLSWTPADELHREFDRALTWELADVPIASPYCHWQQTSDPQSKLFALPSICSSIALQMQMTPSSLTPIVTRPTHLIVLLSLAAASDLCCPGCNFCHCFGRWSAIMWYLHRDLLNAKISWQDTASE